MSGIMQSQMAHKRVTGTSMRSLLSASGQTAYDAATNNSWFNVSAADYAAVFAGISGTTKLGMDDAGLSGAGTAFSGTFGATLSQANATVASGSYIIGLVVKPNNAVASTFRPYIATTFKGTYSTLGTNTLSLPQNGLTYFLRKGASAQGSTSYVAIGPRSSGNWSAGGSWASGGYSSNMSTWTLFTSTLPAQQWLVTTTQPT